jgi:peptidoglycan/LPS O-acetylase OafA/YrhL
MSTSRGIRYIPAIDGLRAVAVIAVMLYHLGFDWIPGGFLGVDLFFVISGYVITRLLLDSIQRSGA